MLPGRSTNGKQSQESKTNLNNIKKSLQSLEDDYAINIGQLKTKAISKSHKKKEKIVAKEKEEEVEEVSEKNDMEDENSFENMLSSIGNTKFGLKDDTPKWKNKKAIVEEKTAEKLETSPSPPKVIQAAKKPPCPYTLFHLEKLFSIKYKNEKGAHVNKNGEGDEELEKKEQKLATIVDFYEEWLEMPLEKKMIYQEQSERLMKQYEILTTEFSSLTDEGNKEENFEQCANRKILTPFNRFYSKTYEAFENSTNLSLSEISAMIKEQWATLSEEEKYEYEMQYQIDNEKHSLDLKKWYEKAEKSADLEKLELEERLTKYEQNYINFAKQLDLEIMRIRDQYGFTNRTIEKIQNLINSGKLLKRYQNKKEKVRVQKKVKNHKYEIIIENLRKLEEMKNKEIEDLKKKRFGDGVEGSETASSLL